MRFFSGAMSVSVRPLPPYSAASARLAYRNALEAYKRRPEGKLQSFLGYYPDIPEDGSAFARAAEYALAAL